MAWYYCKYCGTKHNGVKQHATHENMCEENPSNGAVEDESYDTIPSFGKRLTRLEQLNEDFIQQVRTYSDIATVFCEVMLKEGYEVVFTEMPDRWSDNVYTNPRDVKFPNPQGVYAGWKGYWRGTITPIKIEGKRRKPELGISDLSGSWSSNNYAFTFIRTETGSSGADFSISGHICLDDFPHLHRQHLQDGFSSRVSEDVTERVKTLRKELRIEMQAVVDSDELVIESRKQQEKLKTMLNTMAQVERKRVGEVTAKFTGETKIEMPNIECPFIDMSTYNKLALEFKDKTVVLETKAIKAELEALSTTITEAIKYADERLEHFI